MGICVRVGAATRQHGHGDLQQLDCRTYLLTLVRCHGALQAPDHTTEAVV